MQIFNIGGLELIFILLIAVMVLGPRDMINTARKIGGWVSQITRSDIWATIMNTSQDIRNLPTKIVREAGLEESIKEIQESAKLLGKAGDQIASEVNKDIRLDGKDILPVIKPPEKVPEPPKPALDSSAKYQTDDDE